MINFDINDSSSFMKLEVIEALRRVIDPELQVNVVDLGLIYSIEINESEKLISVEMTLSTRFCPMGEAIVSSVQNCLESNFNGFQSTVDLVWEPAWSYDKISEEGKKQLSNN
jgi:metal-sulfur cluster biosynthetic enzyme